MRSVTVAADRPAMRKRLSRECAPDTSTIRDGGDAERGAQQPDRGLVGAPVDRRRRDADLQCLAVAPDQLRAPGARLHVDVHDRAVAIGLDDAVETA